MSTLEDLPFDIASLHAAYAEGVSPNAVIDASLARLAAAEDPGIFLHLRDPGDLAAEAAALPPFDPATFPLWGLPFAVKDNIDVAGCPTTAACPAFAYDAAADATVIARLRAAGAIPLGKTNLDQFATGLVGVRTPHPAPRNAVDPALVPGGSSSGSAVSVARGIVSFALGTDTAGSGRVPAALNDIVGLKPSLGAISASGVVPACRTLDTVSIFAATVEDAWTAYRAAAAFDAEDPYSRAFPVRPLAPAPPSLRVGVPDAATLEFFGDTARARAFEADTERLAGLGAEIVELDFTPFFEVAGMLYEGAWVAERMTVIEDLLRRDAEAVHPVTRRIVGAADRLSAADAFRGIYRLEALKRQAAPSLDTVDLLAVPTIPTAYSLADLEADPVGPNTRLGTYTNFVNLMDLCGIAVPTGLQDDGRPGSLTLLAPAGQDGLAAAVARQVERRAAETTATQVAARRTEARPAPMPDEIALAVVGAHLSGMPLNHELTSRGARFLSVERTAPCYRLFALPGGPPTRPGLLRGEKGGAVDLEIWALPARAFGDLMASVPAPLCIGTVELEHGEHVQGFLVEASATVDAEDITHFGGWRAYASAVA
ncbi:allophanate hydrolase [Rhodosalinus sp.]|uniref:allophanate hydrolase n=1 Tax=Rhodosalinus sp. TaxID=2047741 RepID=UPI003565125A